MDSIRSPFVWWTCAGALWGWPWGESAWVRFTACPYRPHSKTTCFTNDLSPTMTRHRAHPAVTSFVISLGSSSGGGGKPVWQYQHRSLELSRAPPELRAVLKKQQLENTEHAKVRCLKCDWYVLVFFFFFKWSSFSGSLQSFNWDMSVTTSWTLCKY